MKPPSFTKTKFLAWAKSLPEGKRFRYWDNYRCPVCMFLKTQGFRKVWAGSYRVDVATGEFKLPLWLGGRLYKAARQNNNGTITKADLVKMARGK